jgi:hypothetical protein
MLFADSGDENMTSGLESANGADAKLMIDTGLSASS